MYMCVQLISELHFLYFWLFPLLILYIDIYSRPSIAMDHLVSEMDRWYISKYPDL